MHLPGRKCRYLHGFLRFSSTQPWCASGSTATKHRKYQCFQLLLSSSVALDLAAAVDRWQQNLVNTSVFELVLFAKHGLRPRNLQGRSTSLCKSEVAFEKYVKDVCALVFLSSRSVTSLQTSGGPLTSSRITPDSLLPFVHPPPLSSIYIYIYEQPRLFRLY